MDSKREVTLSKGATTSYWYKNRNINHWNRTEGPEVNLHTYGQKIYDKEGKTTMGERQPFL